MENEMPEQAAPKSARVSARANALAVRLESGLGALAALAATLTDVQWRMHMPHDRRPLGVVVHHVASVLPVEITLAQSVTAGRAVTGVTADDINLMNAAHALDHATVTREAALDLLRRNGASAAAVIRSLSDTELDTAATVSLYADAPLTCQFVLEDHAVRHSYHHLARIRAALNL
jgi:hypothetical protein